MILEKIATFFPKKGGGSKAVWNFSKNSSIMVGTGFPKSHGATQSIFIYGYGYYPSSMSRGWLLLDATPYLAIKKASNLLPEKTVNCFEGFFISPWGKQHIWQPFLIQSDTFSKWDVCQKSDVQSKKSQISEQTESGKASESRHQHIYAPLRTNSLACLPISWYRIILIVWAYALSTVEGPKQNLLRLAALLPGPRGLGCSKLEAVGL